ncbi:MAG: MFS transporter [Hyphomicrobiaceae bacterium]
MSRRFHTSVPLSSIDSTRARGFIVLFTCDSTARSILISLVPLQAYALLGAAQVVSVVYFLVAILGLAASLAVPTVLHLLRRRWVLTAGAVLQIASVVMLAWGTTTTLVAGLLLQAFAAAALDVVINLYLLDHIPRRGLNNFEPKRLLFAGSAFALGPWLGVYLARHVGAHVTYVVAAVATLSLLVFFWSMRLADNPSLQVGGAPPPNPLRFVARFFSQPRLALAWFLALGRNGWWVMYFIYTPIYVANAGYSAEVGGGLVSLGLAAMLMVRVWGRIGQVIGMRNLLTIAYGLSGLFSIAGATAAFLDQPRLCMALVCIAAWSATAIDGAGNVPFLRAVRHFERVHMTSVFMTFRHVGALAIPGVLALVLWFLPLPAVFAVGGAMAIVMAGLSRFLPRGM